MGLMSLKIFDFFKSNKILVYQRFYKLKKIVVYNFLGSFMTSLPDTSHTGGVYTDLKPTKFLSQDICSAKIWTHDFSSAKISSQDFRLLESWLKKIKILGAIKILNPYFIRF